ncbi:MAG: hypothetical protein HOO95_04025 [Gallionella sp.]|nr:hypothetical protein [Gallionella sp.]
MFNKIYFGAAIAALLVHSFNATAASDTDLQTLRDQVQLLEQRVNQQSNSTPVAATGAISEGAFNPAISLILSGTYGQLQQAEASATGFAMSPNNSGYSQGFSLKESELGISANIDPQFRGVGTFSLDPAGGISVENGFVQTSALGNGLNLKFGRYFSGLGYLNEQHTHAWDFVDQPLVYRVLWDNQIGEDGLQLKWLAPTDMFVEVGGEVGRGRGFPGTDRQNKNGSGAGVLFAHIGDDIGIEHSWRAGASLHQTHAVDRVSTAVPDFHNGFVTNSFSGDSQTTGLDFVWKYSPNGNTANRYVKLQGEYFRRKETGDLTYNTAGTNITDSFDVTQSGWYLQSVAQFMPHWHAGLRYDQLDSGTATVGAMNLANVISNYGYTPKRTSLMVDYNPSEFTRVRVQLAQDESRQGLADKQFFVQYIMSLGAHGAHQY